MNTILLEEIGVLNLSKSVEDNSSSLWILPLLSYFFISFFLLVTLLIKVVKIRHLKEVGQIRKFRDYNIVEVDGIQAPFSFFKDIFIPKKENIEDEILSHEQVHAQEIHTLDILLSECMIVLFWFNPMVYFLRSAISMNHEFIADSKYRGNKYFYINTLISSQIKEMEVSLGSHFSRSEILERIKMINTQNRKTMKVKFSIPVVVVIMLFTFLCCEEQQEAKAQDTTFPKPADVTLNSEAVFDTISDYPKPEGGITVYYNWIMQNLKYPEYARKNGIEGKVFVQFIIDKNGSFQKVSIAKGASASIDKEALRVVSMSEPWVPGTHNGKKVNTRMVLPVSFKLPKKD